MSRPKRSSSNSGAFPGPVKDKIWRNTWGILNEGLCPCCFESIRMDVFEAGHIEAKVAGGSGSELNGRPVCRACNASMKSTNMVEWMSRNGMPIDTDVFQQRIESHPIMRKIRLLAVELFDDLKSQRLAYQQAENDLELAIKGVVNLTVEDKAGADPIVKTKSCLLSVPKQTGYRADPIVVSDSDTDDEDPSPRIQSKTSIAAELAAARGDKK